MIRSPPVSIRTDSLVPARARLRAARRGRSPWRCRMVRIQQVLCPVDRSPASRLALEYAVALAQWYQARLEVLEVAPLRSEEHTSELQSLMRNSYAVLCLTQKTIKYHVL